MGHLVNWILVSAAPAGGVIGFFWKGDDALSTEFKQWLSDRLLGLHFSTRHISSLDPMGLVFTYVYGIKYFHIKTFIRVSLVSFAALLISFLIIEGNIYDAATSFMLIFSYDVGDLLPPAGRLSSGSSSITIAIALVFTNIFFDYMNMIKSRLLIFGFSRFKHRSLFIIMSDVALTVISWCLYVAAIMGMVYLFMMSLNLEKMQFARHVAYNAYMEHLYTIIEHTALPFLLTTSVTLLFSILYIISLSLLRYIWFIEKTRETAMWILPVKTLPVRSIGVFAGSLVFIIVAVYNLLPI